MFKQIIKKFLNLDENEINRANWLAKTLSSIPHGLRLLDAGAGELKNKPLCSHLCYVSQDICQYEGKGDGVGFHTGKWDTKNIDLVCDIAKIPEDDNSFDAILCSEVFEHLPDPILALDEFSRLLKPGGLLIITAPFASLVHFAPYHYSSGFSRYWYEHHLPLKGFELGELSRNGDWFSFFIQNLQILPSVARRNSNMTWPLFYFLAFVFIVCLKALKPKGGGDIGCFGWHCVAIKCNANSNP